jgi:hypothetical protein
MELRDHATGDFLALTLRGYQFAAVTDEWDSNWLRVQIDGSLGSRTWTTTDPCLDTIDVDALARWLSAAAEAPDVLKPLWFTEPNLSFELADVTDDLIHIRTWLELEARPPWAEKGYDRDPDLAVSVRVSPIDLRSAADSLLAELSVYPTRVARTAD